MAGYIGSKGSGIISGIGASIADLNLTDKASANGTTEANKVLTADGNKDVTAIRNLTATGTVTRALTRGSIDVGNSSGVSTPLAIGGANTLLQSDGTDASWATVSGSDSRQSYVTNATVAARAAVFLNNDGTVDQTPSYPLADSGVVVSTFSALLLNTYGVQYDGHCGSSAYKDSGTVADRRHVTIYKYRAGTSAANARYVVSAVAADGTMTHGTPAAFNSSGPMNNCTVKYNANIDRFIAVYDYGGWNGTGNYGGIAVAVGTLNASNNTVAWTHTTNLGNAGSYSTRGFLYYDGYNSIESPSFDIADDGSHLMMSHMGSYNNQANENNDYRLSVKVATINSSNNTVSGGSWLDALVSSGTKYNRPNVTPSSLHWHQNSSQYILCASSDASGNRYAYGDQQVFLFTVSGNTPTQVNYALGPLTMEGMTVGFAAPQISWYDVTSTKCWGIGLITWMGSTTAHNNRVAFYEMTVGSGSISNIKGRSVLLKDTTTFEDLQYSNTPNNFCTVTASVVYNSSGTAFVLYKPFGTEDTAKNIAVLEMVHDETNVGTVVNLNINQVSSDQSVAFPKGGGFVTYDTGRDFLFTLGTDLFANGYGTARDYQIVAATIDAASNGSGLNPIGIHDSSSSASSGDTITVAQSGSVVSGFSGLTIGAPQLGGGKKIGYATSATKVFVTADGKGG